MSASSVRLFTSLVLFSSHAMGCSDSGGDGPDAGPVPILDFVELVREERVICGNDRRDDDVDGPSGVHPSL